LTFDKPEEFALYECPLVLRFCIASIPFLAPFPSGANSAMASQTLFPCRAATVTENETSGGMPTK
jgi:hypothetical protein